MVVLKVEEWAASSVAVMVAWTDCKEVALMVDSLAVKSVVWKAE